MAEYGGSLPVGFFSKDSSVRAVAANLSETLLLAANGARLMFTVYNNSIHNLFLKFGANASDFSVKLPKDSYYEVPLPTFTGEVYGYWDGVSGDAKITEFS